MNGFFAVIAKTLVPVPKKDYENDRQQIAIKRVSVSFEGVQHVNWQAGYRLLIHHHHSRNCRIPLGREDTEQVPVQDGRGRMKELDEKIFVAQ